MGCGYSKILPDPFDGKLGCIVIILNTLTSGLIQAVCKKTAGSHVALCGNISAPVSVTDLVEVSKDAASLVLYT